LRFAVLLACVAPVLAGGAQTTPIAKTDLHALADSAERELRGNILPFWLKHAPDREHGGFHAFISEDMRVRDDEPRGALLTSRILWTFSAAYRRYHEPEYLEMARRAYRDLIERFQDKKHGGFFWSISDDGRASDARKQIYGQVFAIYGLTEYFRAAGDKAALEQAVAVYRLIEQHARDAMYGGYHDALDREWRRMPVNLLGPGPKSQNSHIHILEAFTNLLRVWPDEGLRARQRELIELLLTRILDPRTHHLVLFMQDDWTSVGDEISYGHDIELSWLIVEAAEVLGDPALLTRAKQEAVAIARATLAEGIDADGGVFSEGGPPGITNSSKEWWEQAEAAVGFLGAYQISGDQRFFAQTRRSWDFIQAKLVDRKNGDWHNTLTRDGTPLLERETRAGRTMPMAKLSIWKCPYHNSRACLELIERLEALTK
jgi:mannobiose 2-epimerase